MYKEQQLDSNPATVASPRKQTRAETSRATKMEQTNPNAVVELAKQIIHDLDNTRNARHPLRLKNHENDSKILYLAVSTSSQIESITLDRREG